MYRLEDILSKLQIKSLNDFQKQVLNVFLNSNKNILLIAPTGIGKTTIAEIIVLMSENKSVYISPLRALSYQVYNELSQIEPVRLATGDVYIDDQEEVEERIIMTTYEKMDSMIRRNYDWLNQVSTIFLDELHNMRDPKRSEAIELILEGALEKGKRIITASATIGEIERIAEWLNAEIIRADKRPVPLFEYVKYGNKLIDKNGKVIELKKDLIEYILDKGKNILIFENTRKRAESEYDRLKLIYKDKVILFHGGLSREEREEALQKIIRGEVKIVVSTTALGQGVNLPIYCVLLKEMELPQVENGRFVGWRRMSINEYKQIAGRAGRPRFDKEGIAVIEAKSEYQAKLFTNYLKDNYESIKSYLTPFKFILVHLSRNETETENELLNAIKYTYTLRNIEPREIKLTLDKMTDLEIITEYNANGEKYYSLLPFGRALSYSYLDLEDAEYYRAVLKMDNFDIIHIIANSPKVIEVSRGADVEGILRDWVHGKDPKELVKYGTNITEKDVKNIIDVSTWQSYSFYAILKALNHKETNNALFTWLEIESGVPKNALNLVKLKGVGRKLALFLYQHGYSTKKEICSDIQNVINIMEKDEEMKKQTWRIKELCKSKK